MSKNCIVIVIALLAGCADESHLEAPDAGVIDAPAGGDSTPRFGGSCAQTSFPSSCESDAGWCVVAAVGAAPTCRARCVLGAIATGESVILDGQLYSCPAGQAAIPLAGPGNACYCLPETAVQR